MAERSRLEGTEFMRLRSFVLLLEEPGGGSMQTVAELMDSTLSQKQKNMVKMYYIQQLPMREIARQLGVNASTISRGLKAAREKMNLCLDFMGAGAALRR